MESVLLLLVMGVVNIFCFCAGAKVGQSVSKDEPVEIPTINPVEMVRQAEVKREQQKKNDCTEAILRNIEVYDGTAAGQKDVPGR